MAALSADPPSRETSYDPERPRNPRPPRRDRRRRPSVGGRLVRLAAGIAALAVALLALSAVFDNLNPFGSDTIDRSHPALLKSIQDLAEYHAASANLQVIVDVEQDARFLPSFIKGERVLFVAAGSVDAIVDFGGFKDGQNLKIEGDKVTATLPRATLDEPRLDPGRSRVYDRDRGLFDRVGDVFSDNPADDQPLYQLAERKLLEAARADKTLTVTAERNTKQMLEGMLRGAGFERVTVRFRTPL
jgi:hypothetical protein